MREIQQLLHQWCRVSPAQFTNGDARHGIEAISGGAPFTAMERLALSVALEEACCGMWLRRVVKEKRRSSKTYEIVQRPSVPAEVVGTIAPAPKKAASPVTKPTLTRLEAFAWLLTQAAAVVRMHRQQRGTLPLELNVEALLEDCHLRDGMEKVTEQYVRPAVQNAHRWGLLRKRSKTILWTHATDALVQPRIVAGGTPHAEGNYLMAFLRQMTREADRDRKRDSYRKKHEQAETPVGERMPQHALSAALGE